MVRRSASAGPAGAAAAPKSVQLYANDRDGRLVVVRGPSFDSVSSEIVVPSTSLLSIAAAPDGDPGQLIWPRQPSTAAPSASLLGGRVRRVINPNESASGQVVALRGVARLRDPQSDRTFSVSQLIEVRFHESRQAPDEEMRTLPALTAEDAGRLVISDANEAVGLIVAGAGYVAAVAPLAPYLAEHGLTLADASHYGEPAPERRTHDRLVQDLEAFIEQLATEPRFPLGGMEIAA